VELSVTEDKGKYGNFQVLKNQRELYFFLVSARFELISKILRDVYSAFVKRVQFCSNHIVAEIDAEWLFHVAIAKSRVNEVQC